MKGILLATCLLVALLPVSCSINAIEGSGIVTSEQRDVSGFSGVALSNMGLVVLTQGDEEGLRVTADDNLMEYIVTEVRNGTLHIGLKRGAAMAVLRPTAPIRFDIDFKDLTGLAVTGSGSFEIGTLDTPSLEIAVGGSGDVGIDRLVTQQLTTAISGSGVVVVGGETRTNSIAISGSGEFHGRDLDAEAVAAGISGSGVVIVTATERLDVDISGNGTVRYFGSPQVTRSITGNGTIEALGSRDREA
jgi:hypothetical protein